MPVPSRHFVNGHPLTPPFPAGIEQAVFGMGCFWGAERKFWQAPGVYTTAVGYAGGYTQNATYKEVCSGMTGHTEVVLVVFDPDADVVRRDAEAVLGEPRSHAGHAAGQRRRHAVPLGVYCYSPDSLAAAARLARRLSGPAECGRLRPDHHRNRRRPPFYYAEDYHQQYLAKNPNGYCGIGGTGVTCQIGRESLIGERLKGKAKGQGLRAWRRRRADRPTGLGAVRARPWPLGGPWPAIISTR